MDLLEFDGSGLYYEDPLPEAAAQWLERAASDYPAAEAETALLRAFFAAPDHLAVLVGLYRFYYYQHRLDEAAEVAARACRVSGVRLGLPAEWAEIEPHHVADFTGSAVTCLRFLLLALKGWGYLDLRRGRVGEGRTRLRKVRALDPQDRLGAGALLAVIDEDNPVAGTP